MIRKHSSRAYLELVASMGCGLLSVALASSAQSSSAERTFHAPKAKVQKALSDIPAYSGGKLPVLEGFADAAGSLDKYQRGYYKYEVQLKPISTTETAVQVTAKITAWYAGPSAANSGYRVLKSSGRLESDLLDSLDEKLNAKAATTRAAAPSQTAARDLLPDTPSASTSFFNIRRLSTSPSSAAKPVPGIAGAAPATKRAQTLAQEADNLEEILHNQSRPSNLAVVKRSNTPVVAQPLEGAEVLFQADGEDEFEVLDSTEGWIHIQISGLSRGWIRRDYVDLPGAATISVATMSGAQGDRDEVRQTKEEVGKFPGKWEALDGKQVKIIWVQPMDGDQFGSEPKWSVARSVFRKADAGPADTNEIAGVVVIFDSADGGMAATTLATLQQWRAGHLPDDVFWRRCWRDPAEAFKTQN